MADQFERRTVKVVLVERNVYGSLVDEHKYEADTVADVIEYLGALLDSIQPELRATAKIEFSADNSAYVTIWVDRPETDEEFEIRRIKFISASTKEEARERAELARLRAKYGDQL